MSDLGGDTIQLSTPIGERSSTRLGEQLDAAVGAGHVLDGTYPDAAAMSHDVALGLTSGTAAFVVPPASRDEVVAVLAAARAAGAPVVARGAGTGLSGGASAVDGAVVVSFARLTTPHIDAGDQVAVVGPGVTLATLDAAAAEVGLTYPIRPPAAP